MLELELTEGTLMSQGEGYLRVLLELRQLGVRLAVDDFGTGYSSLAYLKRFPLDTFVRDIPQDDSDLAIIPAMVSIAASLKLETVAEGVETPAQSHALLAMGCGVAQGWLYSRALPAEQAMELLAAGGVIQPGRPCEVRRTGS